MVALRSWLVIPLLAVATGGGCAGETASEPTGAGGSPGSGGKGGAAGSESCESLPFGECAANARCQRLFGRSVQDPFLYAYTGCWTAFDETGDRILYGTTVSCYREKPGASCYCWGNTNLPDGWQPIECTALPSDCGGPTQHPCIASAAIHQCQGLSQAECAAKSVCQIVSYGSGPEKGQYAGCGSVIDVDGNSIASDQPPYCGRRLGEPHCYVFSTRPPDGWALEACTSNCR